MDKKVVELNSGWKIAYEENYKCKNYADDIYDIKTLKSKTYLKLMQPYPVILSLIYIKRVL